MVAEWCRQLKPDELMNARPTGSLVCWKCVLSCLSDTLLKAMHMHTEQIFAL